MGQWLHPLWLPQLTAPFPFLHRGMFVAARCSRQGHGAWQQDCAAGTLLTQRCLGPGHGGKHPRAGALLTTRVRTYGVGCCVVLSLEQSVSLWGVGQKPVLEEAVFEGNEM